MTGTRFTNGKHNIEKWNDVFEVITAEPRRQLIVSLLDTEEAVPLPESAVNPNAPADSEALKVELYHRHLPMLADREFVEWDTDPLVAERGPRFEEVAAVFEALHTSAGRIPDSLVVGCQRLEQERHLSTGD